MCRVRCFLNVNSVFYKTNILVTKKFILYSFTLHFCITVSLLLKLEIIHLGIFCASIILVTETSCHIITKCRYYFFLFSYLLGHIT